jgi:catechol 2,3-dioxygenase-like lactoylglutathione lyase family enzyme
VLSSATLTAFVPTLDRDAARAFYGETLGLRLVADTGFALVFEAGATSLRVTPVEALTPQPFTVLGWDVPNLAEAVRELTARGVEFEKFDAPGIPQDADRIWHAPGGDRVAWFKDPDGNLLSIASQEN